MGRYIKLEVVTFGAAQARRATHAILIGGRSDDNYTLCGQGHRDACNIQPNGTPLTCGNCRYSAALALEAARLKFEREHKAAERILNLRKADVA
jgi:hypothetical protein